MQSFTCVLSHAFTCALFLSSNLCVFRKVKCKDSTFCFSKQMNCCKLFETWLVGLGNGRWPSWGRRRGESRIRGPTAPTFTELHITFHLASATPLNPWGPHQHLANSGQPILSISIRGLTAFHPALLPPNPWGPQAPTVGQFWTAKLCHIQTSVLLFSYYIKEFWMPLLDQALHKSGPNISNAVFEPNSKFRLSAEACLH